MNKTQLIALLKEQHNISVTDKTLNKLLSHMGLDKPSFDDSDVENVLRAFAIVEEHGNREGYRKVAEEFGVNLNALSKTKAKPKAKNNNAGSGSTKSMADTVKEKVEAEVYTLFEQAVDDLFDSGKPYQMLVNIMTTKVNSFGGGMDRMAGTQMRRIEQEVEDTIDIPAEEVGGDFPEAESDISDADFHNQGDEG